MMDHVCEVALGTCFLSNSQCSFVKEPRQMSEEFKSKLFIFMWKVV